MVAGRTVHFGFWLVRRSMRDMRDRDSLNEDRITETLNLFAFR
jgi:hypothetical protein